MSLALPSQTLIARMRFYSNQIYPPPSTQFVPAHSKFSVRVACSTGISLRHATLRGSICTWNECVHCRIWRKHEINAHTRVHHIENFPNCSLTARRTARGVQDPTRLPVWRVTVKLCRIQSSPVRQNVAREREIVVSSPDGSELVTFASCAVVMRWYAL